MTTSKNYKYPVFQVFNKYGTMYKITSVSPFLITLGNQFINLFWYHITLESHVVSQFPIYCTSSCAFMLYLQKQIRVVCASVK